MRALVTGATGLVGSNLVRVLLERGETVRVLVRPGSDPRPLEGLAVERASGDLRDEESVVRAASGVDVVFHAAASVRIGTRGLAAMRAVNVEGARRAAGAARQAGARLVHVSSVDALGFGTRDRPADEECPPDPRIRVPYVLTKREAEAAVRAETARGLDAVIVNPVFVLGAWDWKPSSGQLLRAIARGEGRLAPPGGNDFCHAGDLARGIVAAAARGRTGERYILGGEALGYREAFALFAEITGGPPPLATVPAPVARAAGRVAGILGALVGHEPRLNAASAALGCMPHHFDDRKARAELGYASRPAAAAAREAWDWFKAMEMF